MGLYKRMSERLLPGSQNGARHLPSGDGTFFIYESRGGNVRRNAEFLETANLLSGTENIGLLALPVRFVVMWAGFLLGELH